MRHQVHRLAHGGMALRHLDLRNFYELDIEYQVRFCRDPWICGARPRTPSRAVGKLPGDEEPPLAAYFHSGEPLIEAGDHASESLYEGDRLSFVYFRLTVRIQHGFTVCADHGSFVIIGRVKLVSVSRQPARVMHLVLLARLGVDACADMDILVAQAEGRFHHATRRRNPGRQFHARDRG